MTTRVVLFSVLFVALASSPPRAGFTDIHPEESTGISNNLTDGSGGKNDAPESWNQVAKLIALDRAQDDYLGESVAIDGNTAIVGAKGADVGSNQGQGAAYVFVRTGQAWVQQAKLTAADGMAADNFGWSVAIDGDTAIVGQVSPGTSVGAAYVFVRSSSVWMQQAKLTATGPQVGGFGLSVGIRGDTAVVGAPDETIQFFRQGAVYVFSRTGTTWSQVTKLSAVDEGADDFLGSSVAISQGSALTVLAGASGDNIGANIDQGSGYIFVPSGQTWIQQAKLTAADGGANDRFGASVGISGDTAVVGADLDTIGSNTAQGSAYVYVRSGAVWSQQAQLVASDGRPVDNFGKGVSIDGNTVVVGCPGSDIGSNFEQGAGYIFQRNGAAWTLAARLIANDGESGDGFGVSFSVDGNLILSGVPNEDSVSNNSEGAAYVFRWTASPTVFDFDGDRRSDISVFRPSTGSWYVSRSMGGFTGVAFGASSDRVVPGDYDGDARTDIALFRPSTGFWYIVNSSTGAVSFVPFGIAEDIPTPGDFDGDGRADVSVFRPSQGTWYRQNSSNGSFSGLQFGMAGDVPTHGDFDGDGRADIGIWRPNFGDWYHIRSSNGTVFGERFGLNGDRIVPADYDGDGRTDLAIYRGSQGLWYVRNSSTATYTPSVFGIATDMPVAADYDGDGRADISVFRPSNGVWYIRRSSDSGFTIFPWGQNGDIPTPAAFGN